MVTSRGVKAAAPADRGHKEQARVLYEHLVSARNRLADLPPLTSQDFDDVELAMHEVTWLLLTPPPSAKTDLKLAEQAMSDLIEAARDRKLDLYASAVALVARKLGLCRRAGASKIDLLAVLEETLDMLTFDYVAPKKDTLAALRQIRRDVDARISFVFASRPTGYRFQELPEVYADRKDKAEKPDRFFHRVYGAHARRGMTQADVRRIDPAYYNVLHVWCTRHKRKLSSFLAPSRRSRHR